jgi:hypothetical protein
LKKITPRWMLFHVGVLRLQCLLGPRDASTALHRVREM